MLSYKSFLALVLLSLSSGVIAKGPAPVILGTAGTFAVLAKSGVSTVPPSTITGNVGVSPAAGTSLTGFGFTMGTTNTFATSPQVTGELFAASFTSPTPSVLTTAVSNMQAAYTDASSRPNPGFLNLESGGIGGLVLAPGLYKWTTGVNIPTSVTISGSAADTWIFQIAGDLTTAHATQVILAANSLLGLAGKPQAANIVWAVAGAVSLGTASQFEGIILGATSITMETGSNTNGRLLAQTAVALQEATVVG